MEIDFDSLIKVVETRLREKYRIENIVFENNGVYIEFEDHPSFIFYASNNCLKNYSFKKLCNEIEYAFVSQILNNEDNNDF